MINQCIHIAFGDSAAGCLRAALNLGLSGQSVVVSRDDFTQGPISQCLEDRELNQRIEYWSTLETFHAFPDVESHYNSTLRSIQSIEEKSKLVLWIGNSAHDKIAAAWILSYLRLKDLEWYLVDLETIEKLLEIELVNLAILSPQQVVDLFSHLSPLSIQQELEYLQLWERVANENMPYRILENDRIISVDENYFDTFILSHLTKKEQYLGKLIGTIMGDSEHRLSDVTIESRLLALQKQKKIKIQSNLANTYLSRVRLK